MAGRQRRAARPRLCCTPPRREGGREAGKLTPWCVPPCLPRPSRSTIGHGTHTMGIGGATGDNSKGLAGVNWQVGAALAGQGRARSGLTPGAAWHGHTRLPRRRQQRRGLDPGRCLAPACCWAGVLALLQPSRGGRSPQQCAILGAGLGPGRGWSEGVEGGAPALIVHLPVVCNTMPAWLRAAAGWLRILWSSWHRPPSLPGIQPDQHRLAAAPPPAGHAGGMQGVQRQQWR